MYVPAARVKHVLLQKLTCELMTTDVLSAYPRVRSGVMLNPPAMSVAASIEECVDELDHFIATLERYPETVLAFD